MTNDELLAKLAAWARRHGGAIITISEEDIEKLRDEAYGVYSEAPFVNYSMGVVWDEKKLFHTGEALWHDVIHELGHLFASFEQPQDVEGEDDWLGWELVMVGWCGGALRSWIRSNHHYMTEHGTIGAMAGPKRRRYFLERIEFAKENGLVSTTGRPLAIR